MNACRATQARERRARAAAACRYASRAEAVRVQRFIRLLILADQSPSAIRPPPPLPPRSRLSRSSLPLSRFAQRSENDRRATFNRCAHRAESAQRPFPPFRCAGRTARYFTVTPMPRERCRAFIVAPVDFAFSTCRPIRTVKGLRNATASRGWQGEGLISLSLSLSRSFSLLICA